MREMAKPLTHTYVCNKEKVYRIFSNKKNVVQNSWLYAIPQTKVKFSGLDKYYNNKSIPLAAGKIKQKICPVYKYNKEPCIVLLLSSFMIKLLKNS